MFKMVNKVTNSVQALRSVDSDLKNECFGLECGIELLDFMVMFSISVLMCRVDVALAES